MLSTITTWACNFMTKRIHRDLNIFTRKNIRCYVSLPIPYIRPVHTTPWLSRGYQTVRIMNHYCYCLMVFRISLEWSLYAKYIVLCLNASAKLRNARGLYRCPDLIDNFPTTCLSPINPVNGLLLVSCRWCAGHEILWPRERSLVRRIWTWKLCR